MNNLLVVIFAIFIALHISGCAITSGNVYLNYVPEQNVSAIKGSETSVVRIKLTDKRVIRNSSNVISIKKNGYGMDCDPITADNDIPKLVSDAVQAELVNRGFKIGNGETLIDIRLDQFFSECAMGFWCAYANANVGFIVYVKRRMNDEDRILYSQRISGSNEESIFFRPSKATGISLEIALKNAVANLMNDKKFIDALMAKQ